MMVNLIVNGNMTIIGIELLLLTKLDPFYLGQQRESQIDLRILALMKDPLLHLTMMNKPQ